MPAKKTPFLSKLCIAEHVYLRNIYIIKELKMTLNTREFKLMILHTTILTVGIKLAVLKCKRITKVIKIK